LCDGTRDIAAIVAELAKEFNVDQDELATDVQAFIDDLLERGWLTYDK